MAKIGIIGGTFDPIHDGHIAIASSTFEQEGLDSVIFLPTGRPPHKRYDQLAPAADRLNMAALAIYGIDRFILSTIEMNDSSRISYTVETLARLRNIYPNDELRYIIGGDTVSQLVTWHRADELKEYCGFIAAPRPGEDAANIKTEAERAERLLGCSIILLTRCGPDISSTQAREAALSGAALQTPAPVRDYIQSHGLYGAALSASAKKLKASLSPGRFRHTLSVAAAAVRLAIAHEGDPVRAHLAGLLHDCAKGLDASALIRLIREGGMSLDNMELGMPSLLHAPAGAVLAKIQYGVNDSDVLSAIRWHTTGRRNMNLLDKIVYLADITEPLRGDIPGLTAVRDTALIDINEAVRLAAQCTAAHVLARGKRLHPRTSELSGAIK